MFVTPVKAASTVGNVLTLASILSANIFGVSVFNILIGAFVISVTIIGKTAITIGMRLESEEPVKMAGQLAWAGVGIIGSFFISMVYMAILAGIHYPVDAFSVLALVGIAYGGPKGYEKFVELAGSIAAGRLPWAPKSGGNGGADGH
jgi:hypothetical protein